MTRKKKVNSKKSKQSGSESGFPETEPLSLYEGGAKWASLKSYGTATFHRERDFKKGSKYSELLGYRRAESCIYECGQVHRRCKQVHGSEGTDSRGAQSLYSQSSDPRA